MTKDEIKLDAIELQLKTLFDKQQKRIEELEKGKRLLGERCNQLLKDKGNLTDKIVDIEANCDLAIEGRDVKIKELELELTVEKDQHQEEINLHLHAEDYIKSLEKENAELEEENNKLLDVINNQDVKIADLEQQIEKMKCCQNCKHCAKIPDYDLDNEEDNNIEFCEVRCHERSGWELKEIEK